MTTHDDKVRLLLSETTENGSLKSRESNTFEFKESFSNGNWPKYAKTMAAFANNHGGYILFGIKDKPRIIIGLQNDKFDNMPQEKFTDFLNEYFAPELNWECGTVAIETKIVDSDGVNNIDIKTVGWIYTEQATQKPVIAQKEKENEKISSGDIYYRYRARTQKIDFPELNRIIEERIAKEREGLLKVLDAIRKNGTANLGIVNYSNGRITTPYGVDVAFDRKLVAKVLKKAKYIKEGSFQETTGIPVLKVTGNIDLAEEVPIIDGNPDETYPYIQSQLATKLNINKQDLYALVWFYKLKKDKKFHIEIATGNKTKVHKFSEFALQFLSSKLIELQSNQSEFVKIRNLFNQNNTEHNIVHYHKHQSYANECLQPKENNCQGFQLQQNKKSCLQDYIQFVSVFS